MNDRTKELTRRIMSYAVACHYYFSIGYVHTAARYWNMMYNAKASRLVLFTLLETFSDDEVYTITDYLKDRYYMAMGYY